MSLRLRRLQADYERLQARCAKCSYIRIRNIKGEPPERYELVYSVKGLRLDPNGQIVDATDHAVEIVLTSGYPRQAPQCRMLTSVFHPNIDTAAICIGDHWAAAEALDDLVVRIAEMITYQSYNSKSPLNGEAARWADQNQNLLPIDSADLWPADAAPRSVPPMPMPRPPDGDESRCVNCGAHGSVARLVSDGRGRRICQDCLGDCPACKARVLVGESLCGACQMKAAAYLERARTAIAQRNAKEASSILEAGLRDFPHFQPLADERRAVTESISQAQSVTEQLRIALKERRYVAALQQIAQLRECPVYVADLDRAAQLSESRRARAGTVLERAEVEMDGDTALGEALLSRAKHLCEDHPGVKAMINRLDAQRRRIPDVEGQFLAALKKGDASVARERLAGLRRLAGLSSKDSQSLEEQVLVLENSRGAVWKFVVGSAISSGVIIVVAAIMMMLR